MSLADEMFAYSQALEFKHVARLMAMGVRSMPEFTGQNMVGYARVEIDKTDRWQALDAGKPMVLLAVQDEGILTDIVAFDPRDPDFWALRTGDGWALGSHYIGGTFWDKHPLKVHATPLDWMRADGEGCCVIDGFSYDTAARIRAVPALEVPNNTFARALRLHLTKPPELPEMIVRGGQRHAA